MNDQTLLVVDSARVGNVHTGIKVTAFSRTDGFGEYDIGELTSQSLFKWLRHRGGKNIWAEAVVLVLLGHTENLIMDNHSHTQV